MHDSGGAVLEAKVTRYTIARIRLGQVFVPLAIIATIFARRLPHEVPIGVAVLLQGLALFAFLSAAKRFGSVPLHFENGALSLGTTDIRLERFQVRQWTFVGDIVRLYTADVSFKLLVRPGAEPALRALLSGVFGSPVPMARRGSKRARLLALFAALAGLVTTALAIASDNPALLVGLPFFIFGLAAFGALSQRVAQR
jgi:hypothetical protein